MHYYYYYRLFISVEASFTFNPKNISNQKKGIKFTPPSRPRITAQSSVLTPYLVVTKRSHIFKQM